MGDARHDLGIAAEQAVAGWLHRAGWEILAHRRRSGDGGEVDLIGLDPDGTLVALEVRARRTGRTGIGSEAIDRRRTARMARTLSAFAAAARIDHRGLRLDLVIVTRVTRTAAHWRVRRIPDIGAW